MYLFDLEKDESFVEVAPAMPSGQVPVATGHPNQTDQPDKRMYHIPEPLISLVVIFAYFCLPCPISSKQKAFAVFPVYPTLSNHVHLFCASESAAKWAQVGHDRGGRIPAL